ncbi:ABC transporter permease, partial [Falsiroseomonas sp. HW251]|uniref:ABC transporter permease n=1 Tax=Falsiroseomonas sp. HW251 TaxID=3390998 RepID=UPI003D31D10F
LVGAVPVLLGVAVATFFLVRLAGDPTDMILPPTTPEEVRLEFRVRHGLDRPVLEQFFIWMGHLLQGDFGESIRFGQPAGELVWERAGATLELAFATLVIALVIGIPAGVAAARARGTAADAILRVLTLLGQAVPSFYLGVVGIAIFSIWLRWLPSGGREGIENLILPATTLAVYFFAIIARVTRSCMLDVLNQDYIRTARAKGLPVHSIVWVHALRNALLPVITVVGLQTGFLLGGVVVTETVFSWPGVGRLAIQAIYARDFPVVQAVVVTFAAAFVLVNLIVDLLYAVLDPRVRLG